MGRDRLYSLQARWAPYLFVLPFVILFAIFMAYPLTRSIVLAFHKTAGPRHETFVGLANFRFLAQDRLFLWAVINTTLFTIAFLLIQIPTSLALAILLNSRLIRFRNAFRFAFFSPHLVGGVFVAVLFNLILGSRDSLANRIMHLATGWPAPLGWLTDPNLAMLSVLIAALWLSVGFGMIYLLAALQSVDPQLYEAADVDGAGRWYKFWHVTLPGIRPVLTFMVLVGTIQSFQLFELPYVLLQGPGPNMRGLTIVMYLFSVGFEAGNLGYASAVGWVLVLIILSVSFLQHRLTRSADQ